MSALVPPIAAAGGSLTAQLAGLLAIVVVARLAAEFAERAKQPGVLAEIAAGILIGPSILGWVTPTDTIHLLAEIGAILLLFEVGLHMDLGDLRRVGGDASKVGVIGIVIPGIAIWALATAFGFGSNEAIFIGAAVTATSVGITARVFGEMRVLATSEARTVLGAAVVDDVLALLILTFVTQTVAGGDASRSIEMTVALALGFLVVGGALAIAIAPRFFEFAAKRGRTEGVIVVATIGFALAFASAGAWAGLAPLIGAFIAGIAAARSERSPEFQRQISPVGQLIIPIFFVSVGLAVDITSFADPRALGIAGAIGAVAIVTKVAAGFGMAARKGDRILVGLGMVPRGEVGLIFATLGLSSGVLNEADHAALVLVMLLTTVVTPPLLRARLRKRSPIVKEPSDGADAHSETVHLHEPPARDEAVAMALQISLAARDRPVDGSAETWLRSGALAEAPWNDNARIELFRFLRAGNERSFSLLERTGALAQLFPSLSDVAPHDIDPHGLHRNASWETLLELQEVLRDPTDPAAEVYERLREPQLLLLAAFCRAAFPGTSGASQARALSIAIGLSEEDADEVSMLTATRTLLPSQALEPDLGRPEQISALAQQLGSERLTAGLYVLAVAEFRRDHETRSRLDALYEQLVAAFARPT